MLNDLSDQISGSNSYHFDKHYPFNTYNDGCPYSLVDLSKPSKFDDPPFESSEACKEVEALQLSLMVMLGPHNLDKISK